MAAHMIRCLRQLNKMGSEFQLSRYIFLCGLGSSVGIATDYGGTVRGSDPCGGKIFRTRPDRPWGTPNFLYDGYRIFPGDKEAGAWR
jgi:hypothetical protein